MFRKVLENVKYSLNKPIKNKTLQFGVPFFVFLSLGLLILQQCSTIRYQFRKTAPMSREDLKNLGIKFKSENPTLEEVYEEYKKMDIDNWEMVRIPRPWEEEPSK